MNNINMSSNRCTSGRQQSPIDIKPNKTVRCAALCDLIFYYRSSACNLINTKNTIVIDYDPGSYVVYNTQVYELDRISFTIPAAHTINSHSFPIEAQLNHRNPDTSEILIISVFIDVNDAPSKSSHFFELFSKSLPRIAGQQKHINTPNSWNIYGILPETKSFYTYQGSLPRSPCTENVTWIILDNACNCSNRFYNNLKRKISSVPRPIQDLYSRKVYYNPNSTGKNSRNYGDKIRCYSEREFRKSCAKLTSRKDIVTAKHKYIMKMLTTGSLVAMVVLFALFLIQSNFFSRTGDKVKRFMNKNIFLENPNNKW
jgi:carbonic anhydrase